MSGLDPAWSVRLILAVLGAVGLLAVLAPSAVAAPDECAQADRLLDAGTLAQVQQAEAAYRQVLATTPDSACALTGDAVATSLITAVSLHRAGLADPAPPPIPAPLQLRPPTGSSRGGAPVTVPAELATAVPPVGLVNAVLGLVGRAGQGSDRTLGGTLHRAGEGVVGVSLTLETRQSRVVDGCGVWSGAY